uniref:Uncharacterized protein n=1 Tax=Knipowitschia caucasica TaxID=637954 RepID=A0AAV2J7V1_KNICA
MTQAQMGAASSPFDLNRAAEGLAHTTHVRQNCSSGNTAGPLENSHIRSTKENVCCRETPKVMHRCQQTALLWGSEHLERSIPHAPARTTPSPPQAPSLNTPTGREKSLHARDALTDRGAHQATQITPAAHLSTPAGHQGRNSTVPGTRARAYPPPPASAASSRRHTPSHPRRPPTTSGGPGIPAPSDARTHVLTRADASGSPPRREQGGSSQAAAMRGQGGVRVPKLGE